MPSVGWLVGGAWRSSSNSLMHKLLVVICSVAVLPSVGHGLQLTRHFHDYTIDCESTGVTVTVNATALGEELPDLEAASLRVGEGPWADQCRPLPGPRGINTFKFAYGDCHHYAEELSDTRLRLSYAITGVKVINRNDDSPDGIVVTCMLGKDSLVSAKLKEKTSTYEYVGDVGGPFQFGMTIYKDSFMTVPVAKDDEIQLGAPLWVGIKLNASDTSELYPRDCWATPTPGQTQPEHIFVKNGIIGEDDETFAPVDDVITQSTYGFSFDSFMFRGFGNRVYIKCNIHVCESSYAYLEKEACVVPKYPAFHIAERDLELGSGSGSGYGMFQTRDVGDEENNNNTDDDEETEQDDDDDDEGGETAGAGADESEDLAGSGSGNDVDGRDVVLQRQFPNFYVMHSFQVQHSERKRRSSGSYRIYPKHTMFNNLRSGITLGIIIATTAMFSAVAILLPLHFSGEKVRCLHLKAVKRTI